MVIESTKQGNSIFDEMKSRVFELYMMERQIAYETHAVGDKLNEALEISENDYNFNLLKLDNFSILSKRHESIRRRFVEQKLYIEQMEISEKQKIEAILTSAYIFKDCGMSLINRNASSENIYLLACAMSNINPSEYSLYQDLVIYEFDKLVRLLRNFSSASIEPNKRYTK